VKKAHTVAYAQNPIFDPTVSRKIAQNKESSFNFHSELPDSMKYRMLKAKQARLKVMRSQIQGWGTIFYSRN